MHLNFNYIGIYGKKREIQQQQISSLPDSIVFSAEDAAKLKDFETLESLEFPSWVLLLSPKENWNGFFSEAGSSLVFDSEENWNGFFSGAASSLKLVVGLVVGPVDIDDVPVGVFFIPKLNEEVFVVLDLKLAP